MNTHSAVEIKTLTGLRGLAAMIVVVSHSANLDFLPKILGSGFGQTGVMIFFVLSGFLMTYLYAAKDFNKSNTMRYCFARAGRVLPLYYFTVIVSIVISVLVTGETFYPYVFELKTAILSLALVKAPYVFWTIPVEIHFYLIFVAYWYVHKTYGLWRGVVLLLCLAIGPIVCIRLVFHAMPVFITTYMFSFILGVFIALLNKSFVKRADNLQKYFDYLGLPILILLLLNLPALKAEFFNSSSSTFMRLWVDPITWMLIVSLMLCAIRESRSLFLLRSRFAMFLGDISFGIYLYHGPVIFYFALMTDFPPFVKFLLAVSVTLLISAVSLHLMEKPLSKRVSHLGLRTSRPISIDT